MLQSSKALDHFSQQVHGTPPPNYEPAGNRKHIL
jgi:hypothetical protein